MLKRALMVRVFLNCSAAGCELLTVKLQPFYSNPGFSYRDWRDRTSSGRSGSLIFLQVLGVNSKRSHSSLNAPSDRLDTAHTPATGHRLKLWFQSLSRTDTCFFTFEVQMVPDVLVVHLSVCTCPFNAPSISEKASASPKTGVSSTTKSFLCDWLNVTDKPAG